MSYKKLKVGVIGVGHMGEYHLKKYLEIPTVDFIGIYEPNRSRAIEISEKYKVRIFENLPSLLYEADAVTLACPTNFHYSILKKAIHAHVHVLVEKPACSSVSEAKEIFNLSKREGVIVGVGHVERFRLNEFLKKCSLEDVYYLDALRFSSAMPREKTDVVTDLMIHDIDIVLYLIGKKPLRITALGVGISDDSIDVANARLDFEGMISANITTNRFSDNVLRELKIFQKNKNVTFNFVTNEIKEINFSPFKITHSTLSIDPLKIECENFISSVLSNKKPLVGIDDAVYALEISNEIKRVIFSNLSKPIRPELRLS